MNTVANWGSRLKLVSSAWFALFFYVWLDGKLGAGFLFAALLTAVYWTIGTSMQNFDAGGSFAGAGRIDS